MLVRVRVVNMSVSREALDGQSWTLPLWVPDRTFHRPSRGLFLDTQLRTPYTKTYQQSALSPDSDAFMLVDLDKFLQDLGLRAVPSYC
jgi:hypothetical protein